MVSGSFPCSFFTWLPIVDHSEAYIVRVAQTTLVIYNKNNILLIHNWRFVFLWFALFFDLLTCVNRLDNGINLSTEITELVSYRIHRFLVFEQ